MQRLLNAPENYVDEMLDGIYAAHPELVTYTADDKRCLVSRYKRPGKVGIATGGGSGHLPLFLGYVGEGMADGCSIGNVFQSPSAEQMLAVTKEIDSGAGVLYIYGNYGGDIMNFDMAKDLADLEDIEVRHIIRKGAGPGKDGKNNDGEGKSMHPAEIVGEDAEEIAPEHRTDEGVGGNESPFPKG